MRGRAGGSSARFGPSSLRGRPSSPQPEDGHNSDDVRRKTVRD